MWGYRRQGDRTQDLVRRFGFQHHHFSSLRPWADHLTSLRLIFLVYEIGTSSIRCNGYSFPHFTAEEMTQRREGTTAPGHGQVESTRDGSRALHPTPEVTSLVPRCAELMRAAREEMAPVLSPGHCTLSCPHPPTAGPHWSPQLLPCPAPTSRPTWSLFLEVASVQQELKEFSNCFAISR